MDEALSLLNIMIYNFICNNGLPLLCVCELVFSIRQGKMGRLGWVWVKSIRL